MKKIALILLAFVFLQASSCNEQTAKEISADIDQSLIPVLYYTAYGECKKAAMELAVLNQKWDSYKAQIPDEDVGYSDRFGSIPDYVENQKKVLEKHLSAENVEKSLWVIQDIHCALADWRTQEGIEYYPDHWYEFWTDVDIFTGMVENEMLDLCDWEEVEWQYDYLSDSFYFLNNNAKDLELFGVDEKRFHERMVVVSHSVNKLGEALRTAQRDKVEAAAHALRKDVMDSMMYFGRFSATVAGI